MRPCGLRPRPLVFSPRRDRDQDFPHFQETETLQERNRDLFQDTRKNVQHLRQMQQEMPAKLSVGQTRPNLGELGVISTKLTFSDTGLLGLSNDIQIVSIGRTV